LLESFKSIEALFVDVQSRQSVPTSVGSLAFTNLVVKARADEAPQKNKNNPHESSTTTGSSFLESFKSIEGLFVDVASRQSVQTSVGSLAFWLLVMAREAVAAPKKQTIAHES
jgi:hypothetical protein